MRYIGLALVALLIAVPAGAVAGPDALSIAKRALELAKEPPRVVYVFAETPSLVEPEAGIAHYRAKCPRGYVAISAFTQFGGEATWNHRRAIAHRPSRELTAGGPQSGLVAVCIEARYAGGIAG